MSATAGSSAHRLSEIVQALERWLSARLGEELCVSDLHRHTEGFSWETFTLTAAPRDAPPRGRLGLVIRRQPIDGVLAPYDAVREFENHVSIEAVVKAPIPHVLWLERDPDVLERPFYVMERVDGIVPDPDDVDPFAGADAMSIGADFVHALADIHAVSPGLLPGLRGTPPADGTDPCQRAVDHWRGLYRSSVLVEIPAVDLALTTLERNPVPTEDEVLCHGDYRLGNFVVSDGRVAAVLDWELAHVGDPAEDLTWAAMRAFRGRSGRVGHMFTEDEFYRGYEDLTGRTISRDRRCFWTVLNHVKAIAIYLRGCQAYEQGRSNDLRLAAMGHRCRYLVEELLHHVDDMRGTAVRS